MLAHQMAADFGCVGVVVDAKPDAVASTRSSASSRSKREQVNSATGLSRYRCFSNSARFRLPKADPH